MHPGTLILAAHLAAARNGPWTPKEGEAIILAVIAIAVITLLVKLLPSRRD